MDYLLYVLLALAVIFTFGGLFILIQAVIDIKKSQQRGLEEKASLNTPQVVEYFPKDRDLYRELMRADSHEQKLDEEIRYLNSHK